MALSAGNTSKQGIRESVKLSPEQLEAYNKEIRNTNENNINNKSVKGDDEYYK